ncbi:putative mitochondrial protein [Cucumis melo var. makuwa]|uniref:Mitochondrial protein n=1 Tax=Cucumis melo var. makuwa TaxID=1194695 RepID=A0A5A7TNC4_CUCMM|nr:putative mitochondrial protein [Cucumis melo var. makuwa]
MKSEFEMSMVGELSCFLGLQIKQKSEGIFVPQEKYAKNIIKKFGLEQSCHKRTPVATHVKVTKDTEGARANHKLYRSIICSLLYLTVNRPNIAYAVGICARYQVDPRTSHLDTVKRILEYVHGTSDFGIMYSYDTTSTMVGYCDVDWAGSSDDKKSTSGDKAEYIAAGSARTHAPSISTTLLSDMDSDDLDDVPLARLLKKTNVPEVTVEIPVSHFVSVHSQESSSIEGVFIPTPGIPLASNVQPGPSVHSPPSVSLPFAPNDAHAYVPDNVPGDVSAAPEGKTDVQSDENEPIKRKSQQNRRTITTKIGRKKIPPNIPSVPIDGISFHHEENVQRLKFMVQRPLAAEVNVSNKHQSCMSIMDLIKRAGLTKTISNVSPFYPQLIREFIVNFPDEFNDPRNVVDIDYSPSSPSTDVLVSVLSGGTLSTWLINGIPAVALSIKYDILHKIGIANWFPSSHASSVSATLGTFLYQI